MDTLLSSLEFGPLSRSKCSLLVSHLILSMSVNVTFTYHRGNNPGVSLYWVSTFSPFPLGGPFTPIASTVSTLMTPTPGVQQGPALPLWVVLTQPPSHVWGRDKKRGHYAETSDGHLGPHYITLCVCTCLKLFIIKTFFKKRERERIHQNCEGKKIRRETFS